MKVFILVALLLSLTTGVTQLSASNTFDGGEDSRRARILCPAPVYDFGSHCTAYPVIHEFEIHNLGDDVLLIRTIVASCAQLTANATALAVGPGASTSLVATLRLHSKKGPQSGALALESNDPDTPVLYLKMTGTGYDALYAQPSQIFWGRLASDNCVTSVLELLSRDGIAFHIVSVTSTCSFVACQVEEIEAGSRYQLRVATTPPMPLGVLTDHVVVETDFKPQSQMIVPLRGFINP